MDKKNNLNPHKLQVKRIGPQTLTHIPTFNYGTEKFRIDRETI
jgi:hypothetical protein